MVTLDSFDDQFAHRIELETPFGQVEAVDITPLQIASGTPVLLAPGWGETLELQRECLKEIYSSGRRVIALRHSVLIKDRKIKTPYPTAELQKAETLLLLLKQRGIHQVDVISHSEGSINSTIAATMQPALFRNFVLVTPAGVSGKDSKARIVFGFMRHVLQTRLHHSSESLTMVQAMKRPMNQLEATLWKRLLSFRMEISAMATYDVFPLLVGLRKQGKRIAVLAGATDTAFPLDRMKRHLAKGAMTYNFISERDRLHYGLDVFETKPGGHELYTNTHEIMKNVLNIISSLGDSKGAL